MIPADIALSGGGVAEPQSAVLRTAPELKDAFSQLLESIPGDGNDRVRDSTEASVLSARTETVSSTLDARTTPAERMSASLSTGEESATRLPRIPPILGEWPAFALQEEVEEAHEAGTAGDALTELLPARKRGHSEPALERERTDLEASSSAVVPMQPTQNLVAALAMSPLTPARALSIVQPDAPMPMFRDAHAAAPPLEIGASKQPSGGAVSPLTLPAIADATASAVAEPPIARFTVLARETHFAPARPLAAFADLPRQKSEATANARPQSRDSATSRVAELPTVRAIGALADMLSDTPAMPTDVAATRGAAIQPGSNPLHADPVVPRAPRHEQPPQQAGANANAIEMDSGAPAAELADTRPTSQVATAILANIAPPAPADPVPMAASSHRAAGVVAYAHQAPARTLTLQLHPVDLGVVHVEMHLRDGGLSVKIRAERDDVAKTLESDRQALADVLRSAGQDIEKITIQSLPRDSFQLQADGQGASARSFERGGDGRQAGGDGSPRREAAAGGGYSRQGEEGHGPAPDQSGDRRDLYV